MSWPRFFILLTALFLANSRQLAEAQNVPRPLSSWVLKGVLIDDEETIRSFLRPLIQKSENWSSEDQRKIKDFLLEFGYHGEITNNDVADGSVRATIRIKPATLVRYIDVQLKTGFVERFKQPIFADELARKMSIRPGSPLAESDASQKLQLDAEGERIRQYLVDDGFFEAKVTVELKSKGPFEVLITAHVDPGPPYFVGDIEITGNAAIRSDDIRPGFKHPRICLILDICWGEQRFSRKQLRKDLRALVRRYKNQEGFPGVRIHDDYDPRHSFDRASHTVKLNIDVSERRRIDVDIDGNTSYGDVELGKRLTIFELGSYDDVEVQNSVNSIRDFYQIQGFFEAQVSWERERFPDLNFERILISVDEGPRLRVRKVRFSGNTSIPANVLGAKLGTQIHKRRLLGGASGHTTTGLLAQDINRIIAIYRSQGFLDTTVVLEVAGADKSSGVGPALAATIAAQRSSAGLYVRFIIDEGERSVVDSVLISFQGKHVNTEKAILARTRVKAGQNFLDTAVQADRVSIQRYYFSLGYPRAQVIANIREIENKRQVTYEVTENSPARVGKIAIRGNFKTRDWVIRQEAGLKQGDLVTTNRISQAQASLRRSGLFSSASVSVFGQDNTDQEVINIIIHVQENRDYRYSRRYGGGYSTDSEEFFEVGGNVPNLGGIGASVDVDIIWGQKLRTGEVKLALPRWVVKRYLGAGLNTNLSISGREEETDRFGELTTVGGSLALSRKGRTGIFKGVSLSMRYDYRRRNRDIDLARPAGNSGDIERSKTTTISSSIGPRLVIDKRRDADGNLNPLSPSGGFRAEFSAKFAENYAFGSDRFIKLGFSAQYYWQVHRRVMLSTALSYDHGVPLGGGALLPELERFFAGGDTTVRGYEQDRLAVELIDNPLAGVGSLTQFRTAPAGGNIRLIQNIDLQIEVSELFGFPVASAFFVDTGLITNSLYELSPSDFGVGVGVALARWITPFGAISIEYAVPMTLKLGDNPRGRWHLNFGVLYN